MKKRRRSSADNDDDDDVHLKCDDSAEFAGENSHSHLLYIGNCI